MSLKYYIQYLSFDTFDVFSTVTITKEQITAIFYSLLLVNLLSEAKLLMPLQLQNKGGRQKQEGNNSYFWSTRRNLTLKQFQTLAFTVSLSWTLANIDQEEIIDFGARWKVRRSLSSLRSLSIIMLVVVTMACSWLMLLTKGKLPRGCCNSQDWWRQTRTSVE